MLSHRKPTLRMFRSRIVLFFVALSASFGPAHCSPVVHISNAQIAQRLNLLTGLNSFSTTKPLSQIRLMGWVKELANWGVIPTSYQAHDRENALPHVDGYTTRYLACRMVQDVLGQKLTTWNTKGSTTNASKDVLGWVYNSSNTMHSRPSVRLSDRKATAKQGILVRFHILYTDENSVKNIRPTDVASGMAVLNYRRGNWVVTSWQVQRNARWNYQGGE